RRRRPRTGPGSGPRRRRWRWRPPARPGVPALAGTRVAGAVARLVLRLRSRCAGATLSTNVGLRAVGSGVRGPGISKRGVGGRAPDFHDGEAGGMLAERARAAKPRPPGGYAPW